MSKTVPVLTPAMPAKAKSHGSKGGGLHGDGQHGESLTWRHAAMEVSKARH